ncbi:MAG: hypothetical protein IT208_10315 [Chthonomonadales bacterium]|nr:hypothetical protein [Chthonomonadales bacterium]
MQTLHIRLRAWQRERLVGLARARGVDVEAMAESLLSERLRERGWLPSDGAVTLADAACDTIERRLRRVAEQ